MDPKAIIGIVLLISLIIFEILKSKKQSKKDVNLKVYLTFKSKSPIYDLIFILASIFIISPYIDMIGFENIELYYSALIAALILMYFANKVSLFLIHKRFYNKTPMFY